MTASESCLCLDVGADGAVLGSDYIVPEHWTAPDSPMQGPGGMYWTRACVLTALTAICFAHCKDVTVREHQQPRQLRRAAERAGRPPLVTYKTLDIAPLRRILAEQGQVDKNGLARALSLVRGHFKHWAAGTYRGRADRMDPDRAR